MAQGLWPAKPTMVGYFGKFESSLTRRPVNKYSLSNIKKKTLQIFNKHSITKKDLANGSESPELSEPIRERA